MRTLAQMMTLTGRKALLTGGAGYVGLAIGEVLVELGATAAILDCDAVQCEARAESLSAAHPGRAFPLSCDLLDHHATRAAVRKAVETLGGLDILVHCAAFVGTTSYPGWAVPFPDQTVDAWDAAMRVNLTAAFVLAQEAHSALSESGHGAICLISSIYGMVGPDMRLYEGTTMATPAAYGASKAGLIQLTRYLAGAMGPAVRVNCISPGGIRRGQPLEFVRRYEARTMLGRMATEEDLKGAIAFLVSDLSAYVSGHNLVVDGGWTAS